MRECDKHTEQDLWIDGRGVPRDSFRNGAVQQLRKQFHGDQTGGGTLPQCGWGLQWCPLWGQRTVASQKITDISHVTQQVHF